MFQSPSNLDLLWDWMNTPRKSYSSPHFWQNSWRPPECPSNISPNTGKKWHLCSRLIHHHHYSWYLEYVLPTGSHARVETNALNINLPLEINYRTFLARRKPYIRIHPHLSLPGKPLLMWSTCWLDSCYWRSGKKLEWHSTACDSCVSQKKKKKNVDSIDDKFQHSQLAGVLYLVVCCKTLCAK